MKTYLVLWNDYNELKINVFSNFYTANSQRKMIKKYLGKEAKPKITKVNFGVMKW